VSLVVSVGPALAVDDTALGALDLVVGRTHALSLGLKLRNKTLVQVEVWNSNEDLGSLNADGSRGSLRGIGERDSSPSA
jgi:hypothetical protein